MQQVPLWKILVVLAVLALALAIWPFSRPLRPGLDLAGGTTLVYQVDVPEGADARSEIDDTIEVLRERVDPTQTKNISWRQVAGNRIEISMAHSTETTRRLRADYIAAREALFAHNVTARQIEAALQSPDRDARLNELAAGGEERRKQLDAVAKAYDALQRARAPYEQAEKARRDLQDQLRQLPADADAAARKAIEDKVQAGQPERTRLARAYLDARRQYEAALNQVQATNVSIAEIERILSLPTTPPEGQKTGSQRQIALDQLIQAQPSRAEDIRKLAEAYAAYEKVKGELDDPNDLIRLLRGSGVLEFRIAATAGSIDPSEAQQYRDELQERGPRGVTGTRYKWLPVADITKFADDRKQREELQKDPVAYFATRYGLIASEYGGSVYLLLHNTPDATLTHDKPGWALTDAGRIRDQVGYWAVEFQLNPVGGDYMSQLTGDHLHQPMAIVLDDKVMSAPTIQSRIGGRGQITGGAGGFGREELSFLIRTLDAGSLKARLSEQPLSIQTTGPTFGEANRDAALKAGFIAVALVSAFMIIYYFGLGVIATLTMLFNVLLVLAAMAAVDATFTLSGIAGVILTIGMAVDANVLIYERIREEQERGAEVRRAVQLGFQRALSSIIDANLTTLITCVILGYTATADVKGFAVTLGIGLVANIFTAVFVSHVLIDLWVALLKPKRLAMLPMVVPAVKRAFTINVDWVSKRYFYVGLSLALTLGGIAAMWARGEDFFDIEFRSGTQVTFSFREGVRMTQGEVAQRLDDAAEKYGVPLLEDATPVSVGETDDGGKADRFTVQTLEVDSAKVSNAIKSEFANEINASRPIAFAGMGEGEQPPPVASAPAFRVAQPTLGANINRDTNENVAEFLGGVAIVLDDLRPAATPEQIRERIQRTRMQPSYEGLGYRPFRVIGLEPAADAQTQPAGEPLYRSVAVVTRDENTNYVDSPDAFDDPEGLAATEWGLVRDALRTDTSLDGVSNFTSQVSNDMKRQAIVAIIFSWIAIAVYIWVRFGNLTYGLGAILALVHDVIASIGLAALAYYVYDTWIGEALLLVPFRVDLAMVAAILTLIGYSVNDTIVTFDRIRENRGRLATATPQIINDSINQTLSRTILTAGTVLVSVLALYIFGGPGVHGFAFIMMAGSILGCYSSIAVAAPLLLMIKPKDGPPSGPSATKRTDVTPATR